MQDSITPNKGSRPHETVSCAVHALGQQLPHAHTREEPQKQTAEKSLLGPAPHSLLWFLETRESGVKGGFGVGSLWDLRTPQVAEPLHIADYQLETKT